MRRIDRIVKKQSWIVLVVGLLLIVYKAPQAFDQMGKETKYKNLSAVCEAESFDHYRRMGRYPSEDEVNQIYLECASAAASCVWRSEHQPFYKAPLWAYNCEEG